MNDVFLAEYTSVDNVKRYVTETAGHGIAYVLNNIYGPLYRRIVDELSRDCHQPGGLRIIEYGCGGAMNLLWIVRYMLAHQLPFELACGTDFSIKMIDAAKEECATNLGAKDATNVSFHAIANENLARDLPDKLGRARLDVLNSFDLVVGINTFRYSFRLGKQTGSAQALLSLLRPGGYSVMIDMNHDFPFFRSKLRNRKLPKEQSRLPSLDDYEAVFRQVGFEIVSSRNFCWIPHSAGPAMTTTLRFIAPLFDTLFSRFATRSLIIARRPCSSSGTSI